jgi:hypothetical protein
MSGRPGGPMMRLTYTPQGDLTVPTDAVGFTVGPMISPHNRTKRDLMVKTCVLNALLRFPYLCGADLQTKKCESAHFYKRIVQIGKMLGGLPKSAFCVNSGNANVVK